MTLLMELAKTPFWDITALKSGVLVTSPNWGTSLLQTKSVGIKAIKLHNVLIIIIWRTVVFHKVQSKVGL